MTTVISAIMLLVAVAIVSYYFYQHKKVKEIEYIWVGPGKNPFEK